MKKPKWAKNLTKKELQHIADASHTGRPSLRVALENLNNPHCLKCRCIGAALRVRGLK